MNAVPKALRNRRAGFSLVEIVIASAILTVLLIMVVTVLDATQDTLKRATDRVTQFRDARVAFELLTRNLSQATLSTYWDYRYASTGSNVPTEVTEAPEAYVRQSELHFVIDRATTLLDADNLPGHALFFQAPLGDSDRFRNLNGLLNARGYYVEFGSDERFRPAFVTSADIGLKHRFRLMEYRPPAEQSEDAETDGNSVYVDPEWYRNQLERWSRPVADNVLALIVSAKTAPEDAGDTAARPFDIAPEFHYDSRVQRNRGTAADGLVTQHLMPPLVEVTMIALDQESADRLARIHGQTPPPEVTLEEDWFQEAESFDADLAAYEEKLAEANLSFRVLTATVPIRAAKWSEALKIDALAP